MSTFRVLIVVLASDTEPIYCKLQSVWKRVSHPRTDILFLKAHPNLRGDDFIHDNTLYIGCSETLDSVYEKQMRGFKLLLPRLKDYAFVFRTNLSSYINIPHYLEFCETLPHTGLYSGVVGCHNEVCFASGAGFTITPDLIHRLVDENPPEVFLDDASIGTAIAAWGVQILPAPRADCILNGEWLLHASPYSGPLFHMRIKTDNRENDYTYLLSLFENREPIVIGKSLSKTPFWVTR
jgi:hypothetical protein